MNLLDHVMSERRTDWATLHAYGTTLRARCLHGSNDIEIQEKAGFVDHPNRWWAVAKIAVPYFNDPNWSTECTTPTPET